MASIAARTLSANIERSDHPVNGNFSWAFTSEAKELASKPRNGSSRKKHYALEVHFRFGKAMTVEDFSNALPWPDHLPPAEDFLKV